jgi:hypothetical protein
MASAQADPDPRAAVVGRKVAWPLPMAFYSLLPTCKLRDHRPEWAPASAVHLP